MACSAFNRFNPRSIPLTYGHTTTSDKGYFRLEGADEVKCTSRFIKVPQGSSRFIKVPQ
eukprot:gene27341-biopygen9871